MASQLTKSQYLDFADFFLYATENLRKYYLTGRKSPNFDRVINQAIEFFGYVRNPETAVWKGGLAYIALTLSADRDDKVLRGFFKETGYEENRKLTCSKIEDRLSKIRDSTSPDKTKQDLDTFSKAFLHMVERSGIPFRGREIVDVS